MNKETEAGDVPFDNNKGLLNSSTDADLLRAADALKQMIIALQGQYPNSKYLAYSVESQESALPGELRDLVINDNIAMAAARIPRYQEGGATNKDEVIQEIRLKLASAGFNYEDVNEIHDIIRNSPEMRQFNIQIDRILVLNGRRPGHFFAENDSAKR